jgi:PAS domain S-box-containing protein
MSSLLPSEWASTTSDQLQALFDNSAIGVVITASDGRIVNFNSFARSQFGYENEEVIGQPVEMLIPAASHQRHQGYVQGFSHHPRNRVMGAGRDLFAQKKDGALFPVEVSLSPYANNGLNYVIAFVVDISIRKQSEQIVLDQKQELERKTAEISLMNLELEQKIEARTALLINAMKELEKSQAELHLALEKEKELGDLKSRFVTMASHEFRTPLSTILSSAYIIEQYAKPDDQQKRQKHLDKIRASVQTLTFILEDFLSIERLDKGFIKPQLTIMTEADCHKEIEATLDELTPILKPGQTFRFKFSDYRNFKTDPRLFKNILLNLLSNAIKYSPEGSHIDLNISARKEELQVEVSDQGIGIPENEQRQLFERFFRATNALEIQGTGLGLHIVQKYVSILGGSISVDSELNKGSRFTVTFALDNEAGK